MGFEGQGFSVLGLKEQYNPLTKKDPPKGTPLFFWIIPLGSFHSRLVLLRLLWDKHWKIT